MVKNIIIRFQLWFVEVYRFTESCRLYIKNKYMDPYNKPSTKGETGQRLWDRLPSGELNFVATSSLISTGVKGH